MDLLTKALAVEWGPHGINVNAIAPTVFRSDLTVWMYAEEGNGPAVRENMLRRIPLGRLGEPTDFHGAVQLLASSASDFMTGSVVYLDGGYTGGGESVTPPRRSPPAGRPPATFMGGLAATRAATSAMNATEGIG